MQTIRIKLVSNNLEHINEVTNKIKEIAEKLKLAKSGPIPLPTSRIIVTTRRAPNGGGRESYDHFELRLHKRIIDIQADPRALKAIMSAQIPSDVNIEMQQIE
ncbi:MAG: 30S ribosomal protein S10 [Candidatus Rehaiarchaeum fermentans]|nr:30S ribosomal protein S10 [Candidatus Rehaiarchaeum fermentans]MCW1292148.1 30S ribosomal protein S10 [Candidatus Rehaiarchaeum fermentans]MCW1292368.1 30S ribosomal protein S10 [Candidatus Rehaiarchaeum fermentans]MCW1293195.1 30S ribosomal protein S10 [Candidatus Rehaiarchaeum fermentans]MCW1293487.1 30S ribosomal protein S10 [Candidatus Rehaiarchaeum fermentans]